MREQIPIKFQQFIPMLKKIQEKIALNAFIIFGSQARGNALPHSDFDILLIGNFHKSYFKRCLDILQFAPPVAIDLFCYSISEFEEKFYNYNLTAIDAIDEGFILLGTKFVEKYKQKLQYFKEHGLKKEDHILKPPVF